MSTDNGMFGGAGTTSPTATGGLTMSQDLKLGAAGLSVAGGIMGFLNADETADQNSAIALLNYNAKLNDANNDLLIGSLNAANANKDAQSLQKQWGWQQDAFDENARVIEAASAYKKTGLGMEEGRIAGRQEATFGAAGAAVGVGTPVAQHQQVVEQFGRQIGALEQERQQQQLGNALKESMTAGEFQSQIEHYKGEANIYQMEADARASADYAQANILYQEGMQRAASDQAQGLGSLIGGIAQGASIAATAIPASAII